MRERPLAKKSIKTAIPSLKIDRDFLRSLSSIVEREYQERVLEAQKNAKTELEAARREIFARKFSTDLARDEALDLAEQRAQRTSRVHANVTYRFETRRGHTVEFESGAEIFQTLLLPSDIDSLSVQVWHYDTQFVDIRINFQAIIGLGSAELSSQNEGTLLRTDSELKQLFTGSRPGYHRFLMWGSHPMAIRGIGPFLTALCAQYFVLAYAIEHVPWVKSNALVFSVTAGTLILWVLFLLSLMAARRLFPLYEFSLQPQETQIALLRKFAWGLSVTLLLGVVANLIFRNLLHG